MKSEARLSFFEATSIIIGHGVGSGILSVPYLASRNRIVDLVWIMLLVYGINLLLHLMIAELSYHNGGAQFIKCFERDLFLGRGKNLLTWGSFALLGFSVIINISGFITGGGAVFSSWLGFSPSVSMALFYVLAAAVVFFGMKLVGICEKFAVLAMVAVIGILLIATLRSGQADYSGQFIAPSNLLALYSIVSFSLSAVMSVPQVVKGLDGNIRKTRAAIALGTGVNLGLIALVTFLTLYGVGNAVTQDGALVETSPRYPTTNHYENEINAFIDQILHGGESPASIDNAVITSQIMQAIYDSSDAGKEICLG